jgi:hypothetical protein
LAYNGDVSDELSVLLATFSPDGIGIARLSQVIGFAAQEPIILGDITTPGYAIFVNRDPLNIIHLKVGISGSRFAILDPDTDGNNKGGVALLKLGPDAQAPYAIALVANCLMETFVIKA